MMHMVIGMMMRGIALQVGLVFCVLPAMAQLPPLAPCRPPTFLRETALKEGAFHREKMENDLLCYDLCWSFSDCAAGSFSEDSRLCTLIRKNTTKSIEPVPLEQSSAFIAHAPVCKPFEDTCMSRPCKAGSRCDVLWHDGAIATFQCTQSGCETPIGFLQEHEQAITSDGSVISYTCPDGEGKSVVCEPHGTSVQFQCEERQSMYMFQDGQLMMFTPATGEQTMIGPIIDVEGFRIIDAAVPTAVPNVVLVTTRKRLFRVDIETMISEVITEGKELSYIDCDRDICTFVKGRSLNEINLTPTTFDMKRTMPLEGSRVLDIALDSNKQAVYVGLKNYVEMVSLSGNKRKKIIKKHFFTLKLVVDRKKHLLYCGSHKGLIVIDTQTFKKVRTLKLHLGIIDGMAFYQGSIILLSHGIRMSRYDLKTATLTELAELPAPVSGLFVMPMAFG